MPLPKMVFPAKYEATMVERMFLLPSSRNSTEARAGALVSLAGNFIHLLWALLQKFHILVVVSTILTLSGSGMM